MANSKGIGNVFKLRDIVNVKDPTYGAKGDGTTNDRAAIALADAAVTGGGWIVFPQGSTFKVSSNLSISSACLFEAGANLSIDTGVTVTMNGQVIALSGNPYSGLGTMTLVTKNNIVANQYGMSVGTVVPSNSDDAVHLEYSTNGSHGINIKNQNTGALSDGFIHIWGGTQDVTGSDIRIAAQSSALGGEVNIIGKCNSLGVNASAALNVVNASNAAVAIYANNKKQVVVLPTSNTVNALTLKGSATGSSVIMSALGESNINICVDAAGTGGILLRTGDGARVGFVVNNTAASTRYVQVTPSATNPTIDVSAGLLTIGATSVTINIASGGSTTISTGVGSVKMSTANPATNTAWIPFAYAGTTYYLPGWTTNAP